MPPRTKEVSVFRKPLEMAAEIKTAAATAFHRRCYLFTNKQLEFPVAIPHPQAKEKKAVFTPNRAEHRGTRSQRNS